MSDELHQCPCCKATKCVMDEPCLGCETYAAWRTRAEPEYKYKDSREYSEYIAGGGFYNLASVFNAARELKRS